MDIRQKEDRLMQSLRFHKVLQLFWYLRPEQFGTPYILSLLWSSMFFSRKYYQLQLRWAFFFFPSQVKFYVKKAFKSNKFIIKLSFHTVTADWSFVRIFLEFLLLTAVYIYLKKSISSLNNPGQ